MLDQNSIDEMLTLRRQDPVGERQPTSFEFPARQVLKELGHHVVLSLVFSTFISAEGQYDFQELIELNLSRLVIVNSLNKLLHFLNRVN